MPNDRRRSRAHANGRPAALAAAGAGGLILLSIFNASGTALAQTDSAEAASESEPEVPDIENPDAGGGPFQPGVDVDIYGGGGGTAEELVHVPVVKGLFPGAVAVNPRIVNPVAGDPEAVHRGKTFFNRFNCVGCHAPNGAGGMGPSLSNATFIYGSDPENIYLSILQGRPAGMPAWGGALPDNVIWDLVTYIVSISKEAAPPWGKTVSADGFTIEQVPAEFMDTVNPWRYTTPFSYGQPPFVNPKDAPPLETPEESEPPE